MTVNFSELLPWAASALEGLAQIPVIKHINEAVWIFALVETGHLLFLTLLGGAVFVLNLRVLGLVLSAVSLQDVERAVRPWYRAGVAGALATGFAMATTTARTLLPSGAFFIKMVALVAAILLSSIVAREIRTGRLASGRAGVLRLGVAVVMWVSALLLFGLTAGLNSGGILIGLAGAALLSVAVQRRHRPLAIGLSAFALIAWFTSFNGIAAEGSGFALVGPGVLAALVIAPVLRSSAFEARLIAIDGDIARKLTAFASTLAWVTVAAAGRWIGFS
jgi:hypothetical protein